MPNDTPEGEAVAFRCEVPAEPCAIVMFGASGDLARRKLVPALYDLAAAACLAPRFAILGFARSAMSDGEFRRICEEATREISDVGAVDEEKWRPFAESLNYFQGEYDNPESYKKLAAHLEKLDRERGLRGNRLFYLATPPGVYTKVVEGLERAGLTKRRNEKSWVRIIFEKPFGRDVESARKLNRAVLRVFDESQVYRIDHYLGKETVQNLLVFRFGNGIFEPLWNRNYVDHVQITAAESLGVEQRASFYETAGAVRDMLQNHLLQLLSLVALEPPAAFDATSVRNEKIKVLRSIRPHSPESVEQSVVRGQYGPGKAGEKTLPGYREETGVKPDSTTETFIAAKLRIDNWRWAGVPFYLRTGKRLPRRVTEIAIQFRRAPHIVFQGKNLAPNWLVVNIQPDEGISLSFDAKIPGPEMSIRPVTMDFRYRNTFGIGSRSAYSTLINDCMRGDATLFERSDSVEAAWELVDPILRAWDQGQPPPFPNYAAGSWGPVEAEKLLKNDGREWRHLDRTSRKA